MRNWHPRLPALSRCLGQLWGLGKERSWAYPNPRSTRDTVASLTSAFPQSLLLKPSPAGKWKWIKNLPRALQILKLSYSRQWWMLSHSCCNYCISFLIVLFWNCCWAICFSNTLTHPTKVAVLHTCIWSFNLTEHRNCFSWIRTHRLLRRWKSMP